MCERIKKNVLKDELKYLKTKIKKYITLYLVWVIVYAPLAIWHYSHTDMPRGEIIKDALKGFLWVGENYNSFILWYLLSNIYSLIFIFILRKLKIRYKTILILGTFIGLMAVFLIDYRNGVFEFPGAIGIRVSKASDLGARVVTGFFYIPLGIELNILKNKEKRRNHFIFLIIIGLGLEIGSSGCGFVYECGRTLATTGIVCVLANVALNPDTKYILFRRLSSLLYYWHLWVYTIVCFVFYGMGNMHKGLFVFCVTIGTILVIFGVEYSATFTIRYHCRLDETKVSK